MQAESSRPSEEVGIGVVAIAAEGWRASSRVPDERTGAGCGLSRSNVGLTTSRAPTGKNRCRCRQAAVGILGARQRSKATRRNDSFNRARGDHRGSSAGRHVRRNRWPGSGGRGEGDVVGCDGVVERNREFGRERGARVRWSLGRGRGRNIGNWGKPGEKLCGGMLWG